MNTSKVIELLEALLLELKQSEKEATAECVTSTGHKWMVNSSKALDVTTGLKWDLESRGWYTYDDAITKHCTDECRVPTKEEWLEAAGHGIAEVIPSALDTHQWTSSLYSAKPTSAWRFYADSDGDVYLDYYYRSNVSSLRCVGR